MGNTRLKLGKVADSRKQKYQLKKTLERNFKVMKNICCGYQPWGGYKKYQDDKLNYIYSWDLTLWHCIFLLLFISYNRFDRFHVNSLTWKAQLRFNIMTLHVFCLLISYNRFDRFHVNSSTWKLNFNYKYECESVSYKMY